MNLPALREQSAALLAAEQTALIELERLLEVEHAALLANEIELLESHGNARTRCMTELLRLQDERRALLRAGGYPVTPEGIERMLRDAGAARSEANAWRDCADRTNRCRELNDRNAVLVAARLRRVEGMLDVLVGTRDLGSGYNRDAALGGTQAGRLLATEA